MTTRPRVPDQPPPSDERLQYLEVKTSVPSLRSRVFRRTNTSRPTSSTVGRAPHVSADLMHWFLRRFPPLRQFVHGRGIVIVVSFLLPAERSSPRGRAREIFDGFSSCPAQPPRRHTSVATGTSPPSGPLAPPTFTHTIPSLLLDASVSSPPGFFTSRPSLLATRC